eukprot:TRINITY_DN48885_c0_g1_i1.p1 TRINITY_DN48885_c0_g1~~TRINITY_DN48885_c0_g1_i1.p1  ORF type:complete len:1080 (+),score=255.12 TRINITY_DN48885_c0_g1_i1:71-3310(+)
MAAACICSGTKQQDGLRGCKLLAALLIVSVRSGIASQAEQVQADADVAGGGLFFSPASPAPAPVEQGFGAPFAAGLVSGALLEFGVHEALCREWPAKAGAWALQQWKAQCGHMFRLRGRESTMAPSRQPGHHDTSRYAGAVLFVGALLLMVRRCLARKPKGPAAIQSDEPCKVVAPSEEAVMPKRPKAKAGPPPPPRSGGKGGGKRPAALNKEDMRPPGSYASRKEVEDFLGSRTSPFGKRIHWVKPSCEEPQENSIFGELRSPRTKLQFDKDLMNAMFSPRGDSAAQQMMSPRKSWSAPKPTGICLLDNSRAQNIAIVLAKLAMSTEDLSSCIETLDSGHPRLLDNIELLAMVMPTIQEVEKLNAHKDKEVELRDVERRLLPLCTLRPARIKVMKFALCHESTYHALLHRCKVLQLAGEESRSSLHFRELLGIILQAGNYINSGEVDDGTGISQGERVTAFGIESLQGMASFKVGPISCLHFLCLTMRASETTFMPSLERSLAHLRSAAKERFSQLRTDMEAFIGEVDFARARLREMQAEALRKEMLKKQAEADACEVSEDNECFWYNREPEVDVATEDSTTVEASRESSKASSMSKVSSGQVSTQMPPWPEQSQEELVHERLSMLVADYVRQVDHLRCELNKAQQVSAEVQAYFGGSNALQPQEATPSMGSSKGSSGKGKGKFSGKGTPAAPSAEVSKPRQIPPEQFYGYISGFLDMLQVSWNEIERQPGRWRSFQKSAEKTLSCKATGAASLARQLSERRIDMRRDSQESDFQRQDSESSAPESPRLDSPRLDSPRPISSRSKRHFAPASSGDRSSARIAVAFAEKDDASMVDAAKSNTSSSTTAPVPRLNFSDSLETPRRRATSSSAECSSAAVTPKAPQSRPQLPQMPLQETERVHSRGSWWERNGSRASVFSSEPRTESKSSTASSQDSGCQYGEAPTLPLAAPRHTRSAPCIPPLRLPISSDDGGLDFARRGVSEGIVRNESAILGGNPFISQMRELNFADEGDTQRIEEQEEPACEFHQLDEDDSDACEFHQLDEDDSNSDSMDSCTTYTCPSDDEEGLKERLMRHRGIGG